MNLKKYTLFTIVTLLSLAAFSSGSAYAESAVAESPTAETSTGKSVEAGDLEYAQEQMRIRSHLTAVERNQIRTYKKEAMHIRDSLTNLATDDMVCNHIDELISQLPSYEEQITEFETKYKDADSYLRKPADEIINEAEHTIEALKVIPQIDEIIPTLYDAASDTVVENSAKSDKIFQNVQSLIWKIPEGQFTCKTDLYNTAVDRISESWNYLNDDWHYETGTLKVSVETLTTSYNTTYYLAHIETFSIQ